MRQRGRNLTLIGLAISAAIACQESSTVTGPVMMSPAESIAGNWSGTFVPGDNSCNGSAASASFQQNGSGVLTGLLKTSECGIAGSFKGRIQGNMITGSIDMVGCVGGGVSGTINNSVMELSIGDLTKPLIVGQTPVMYGGSVRLTR